MTKRRLMCASAVLMAGMGVGACASTTTGDPPATGPSGNFEFFSFWTGSGEAEGLDALVRVFKDENPNVILVNATVVGGGGSAAREVLAQRMEDGQPPDSFQIHAGHELIDTYVVADKMESLSFLFEEENWSAVMPPALIDILSHEGDIYAVPVNIHRANMLWYNKSVFAAHNLQPPTTWTEFFAAGDVLRTAGVTPMALFVYGGVEYVQLLEVVLLSELGPQAYRGLWTGATSWTGAPVTAALTTFKRVLEYAQPTYASLPIAWEVAAQQVDDGTAAMTIMGDWAEGFFKSLGREPGVDFGWIESPGTGESFDLLSDTFALPKGVSNREAALAWLRVAGSKAGQDAFNPKKGSIPARTDADRSLYDVYLQATLDDFATKAIVPSFVHGAAAAPSWITLVTTSLAAFIVDGDIPALQGALAANCVTAGVCQ